MSKSIFYPSNIQGQKLYGPLRPWTPAEISTIAWYDADDPNTIIENGGHVSGWNDKSGNSNDLEQQTGSNQPILDTLNGLTTLRFTRNPYNSLKAITPFNLNGGWVAIVVNHEVASLASFVNSQIGASGDNYTIQYRGDVDPDKWQNSYFTDGNDAASQYGAASVSTTAVVIHDNLSLTDPFPFQVGADRTVNNRGLEGRLCEVICGAGTLDSGTKDTVEGYLAWKWGTESKLPIDHIYRYERPVLGD